MIYDAPDAGGLSPVKDGKPENAEMAPFQAASNWRSPARQMIGTEGIRPRDCTVSFSRA